MNHGPVCSTLFLFRFLNGQSFGALEYALYFDVKDEYASRIKNWEARAH